MHSGKIKKTDISEQQNNTSTEYYYDDLYRLTRSTRTSTISENNFALVGMAGVMAGVMHAPLTAIFLIAEITGGYTLFIPLIVTATLSYVTILAFERQSIYTMRLAKRGELMTHHKDKNVLVMLSVDDVLEKDFKNGVKFSDQNLN